jgi:hypothetical protein
VSLSSPVFSFFASCSRVPVRGASGLPHLRRPTGHCKVVENAILLLAGRVGLRFSKIRVPGDGGETLVSTSSWNKPYLAIPHLIGVLLRCRRRANGGGVPSVNSLFRSPGSTVCRSLRVASSSAFCVKVVDLAMSFVEQGRLGLP